MTLGIFAQWTAFVLFALIALLGAVGMATTMSMFRSGIFLMVSFIGVAALFILLTADLLALLQIMMYIGGMLVMILFMVLFAHDPGGDMMAGMEMAPIEKLFSLGLLPKGRGNGHGAHEDMDMAATQHKVMNMASMQRDSISMASTQHKGMDMADMQHEGMHDEQEHNHTEHGAAVEYTCPMHPEVVQSEPGSCPKCGMTLVPRDAQAESAAPAHDEGMADMPGMEHEHEHMEHGAAVEYTCPMHPEVVQSESGSCPKCGMTLVPRDAQAEPAHDHEGMDMADMQHEHMEHGAAVEYTCPMHPEVVQSEPGSCPKCGMTLVPRDAQAEPAAPAHDEGMEDMAGMEHEHEHMEHGAAVEYTCPMHPEVVQSEPGSCPKCGMTLVPVGMAGMDMASMDMSMTTPVKRQAVALAAVIGAILVALLLLRPAWPTVAATPDPNSAREVGTLLLEKYMMAFEGAGLLILLGIFGAVLLGRPDHHLRAGERGTPVAVNIKPSTLDNDQLVPLIAVGQDDMEVVSPDEAHQHGHTRN